MPGEVLLDELQAEQVAQPGEHLPGVIVGDAVHRIGEGLPLQQLTMRAGGFDEVGLVLVEELLAEHLVLACRAQTPGDVGDHLLHTVGQQLVLLLSTQAVLDRAGCRAEVGDVLPEPSQPRTVEDLARRVLEGELGERRSILVLELLREVGEQALADQLQQHVVVALEGDVDVEVLAEPDEPVLEHVAGAAASLAGFLQRVERVPGRERLEGRGERLEVFAIVRSIGAAGEDAVELLQELVVREDLRVGGRQARQQAALVLAVVEQHDLLAVGSVELAALGRVGDRDVQTECGAPGCCAVERHPTLNQGAEHREEAAAGAVDRARVGAIGSDVAVFVQQVGARDAHAVEGEPAVVDAVQPALETVVLAGDAGEVLAVIAAQRHVEAVHAMADTIRDQLREDGGGDAVQGGVAEELLRRRTERGVDDELFRVRVVRRRGRRCGDVGAVADLGHREGSGDGEVHDSGQPLAVVLFGAELQDRRAEQTPLHAGLDLQARVGGDELFEARDVGAVVVLPAVLLREGAVHSLVVDEEVQLTEHAFAVLVLAEVILAPERRVLDHLARCAAGVGPGSEQQIVHALDVDARGFVV